MQSDLFLVLRTDDGKVSIATRLKVGDQTVGRSSDNEISLQLDTISRTHARLSVGGLGVIVTDLQSTNGTWVNRKRVHCASVFPGELIQFGNVQMVLSYDPSGACGLDSDVETRNARVPMECEFSSPVTLSPAQTKVFNLLIQGQLERQIAEQLEISQHTVHNHARKIYEAYGVSSKVDLLLKVMPRRNLN